MAPSVPAVRLPWLLSSHLRCGISDTVARRAASTLGALEVLRRHFDKEPTWHEVSESRGFAASLNGVAYALPADLPILRARSATAVVTFFYYCALRYSPSRSERSASTFATGLTV